MNLNENQENLIQSISGMTSGCRFASFTYSPKSTGGKFRYLLLLGASYQTLLENSLAELTEVQGIDGVDNATFTLARQELMDSIIESLSTGQNSNYTKAETYVALGNGVKLNKNDFSFEIDGLVQSKTELEPATKRRPSAVSPKARAKAALRKLLPIGRYASFCLEGSCLETAKANGETFEIN